MSMFNKVDSTARLQFVAFFNDHEDDELYELLIEALKYPEIAVTLCIKNLTRWMLPAFLRGRVYARRFAILDANSIM